MKDSVELYIFNCREFLCHICYAMSNLRIIYVSQVSRNNKVKPMLSFYVYVCVILENFHVIYAMSNLYIIYGRQVSCK